MSRLSLTPALLLVLAPAAPAQVVSVLHSFRGGSADGANPLGSLLQLGPDFYGMADAGGSAADRGVIFRIGIDGTGYGVTHTFTGGANDGRNPSGSLTSIASGLYGVTQGGGITDNGVTFRIGADGTGFGVVRQFMGSPGDGSIPQGTLAVAGSTFFGTTGFGGGTGNGTIFKVNADGTGYAVLHSFNGGSADGSGPGGGAPAISGSTLYGMTALGGINNGGVVYKINSDGSGLAVLHSFTLGPNDGFDPFGSVIVSGNSLYGMTMGDATAGNGVVFRMNTDGTGFTLLHSFAGGTTDGRRPLGELLLSNSTLYGTTYQGGSADLGTIFSIGIDGTSYDLLHSFLGGLNDGAQPAADLIFVGPTLYGTTTLGGVSNNGTIFSFTPVPEPPSLLLVAAASSLAVLARRRLRGT